MANSKINKRSEQMKTKVGKVWKQLCKEVDGKHYSPFDKEIRILNICNGTESNPVFPISEQQAASVEGVQEFQHLQDLDEQEVLDGIQVTVHAQEDGQFDSDESDNSDVDEGGDDDEDHYSDTEGECVEQIYPVRVEADTRTVVEKKQPRWASITREHFRLILKFRK